MRFAPTLLAIVASASTFLARGQESFVGSVKTADGGSLVRRGAGTIPTRVGLHLLLNDVLVTSVDGRLGVILEDGTRISLGPNTELTIDRFVYQPADGRFGLLLVMSHQMQVVPASALVDFGSSILSIPSAVRSTNW